jgi:hypothetical protein
VWVAGVLAAGAADQPAGDDAELWIVFCIVYFLWCGFAGVLAAGAADQPAGDDAELWIVFCIVYFLWCGLQVSSLQERLTSLEETMLNFGLCSVLFIFFGVGCRCPRCRSG